MSVLTYIQANWYWIVAGSTTQVWSSLRCQYVAVSDSTYQAWLTAGGVPTRIGSATELIDVLLAQWAPPLLAQSGIALTSTGTPALNGTYKGDAASLSNIASLSVGIAAGKPLPGGGGTFNYPDASNTQHAFSAANFLNFAAAIEGLIYATNQAISTLVGGGSATFPTQSLTIA